MNEQADNGQRRLRGGKSQKDMSVEHSFGLPFRFIVRQVFAMRAYKVACLVARDGIFLASRVKEHLSSSSRNVMQSSVPDFVSKLPLSLRSEIAIGSITELGT
ncbi:hypothetical protein AC579_5498 [Pseudocercospora musae]|uniref:Uncharacterized protein n=1 Tax=Pseudocercospora musae TaxID=113226 RepID=A0A139IPS2_9PEZI|nr:hypothetical protein AC579_5498 [Pseudocercospora musae]